MTLLLWLLVASITDGLDLSPALLRPNINVENLYNDRGDCNKVVRLSTVAPDIFHIQNLLSISDCQQLISQATDMETATTRISQTKQARTNCQVSWMSNTPLINRMISTTADIFIHPLLMDECEIEDLQVLRYEKGGQYTLHHDGEPRLLTVIYYLNGVAGTWFPFAGNRMVPNANDLHHALNNYESGKITHIGTDWVPGVDGVLINSYDAGVSNNTTSFSIAPGDAIAFYNYNVDGTLSYQALHTGLPASETKWIANHWYRIPRFLSELRKNT